MIKLPIMRIFRTLLPLIIATSLNIAISEDKTWLHKKFQNDSAIKVIEIDGKQTEVEEGMINNLNYRLYPSDGSGTVAGWEFGCRVDNLHRTKTCTISSTDQRKFIGIVFIFNSNGKIQRAFVSSSKDIYPGSTTSVRAGEHQVISTQDNDGFFNFKQSHLILAQALKSENILVRQHDWPYNNQRDGELSTTGLKEAIEVLQWARKNKE